MSVWTVLLDIVVLLGAGALLGGIFERLRQSAIVGYLVAGALLGPNCLHVIDTGEEVVAVSELGVALLLFVIGLEFSWRRLRGMGRVVFGSGVIQIVATGLIAAGRRAPGRAERRRRRGDRRDLRAQQHGLRATHHDVAGRDRECTR